MRAESVDEGYNWDDLVALGEFARAQGREGEVVVNQTSDAPDRFRDLTRIFVLGRDGRPVAWLVASTRVHKGRPVVRLVGVSSIADAQALAGKELRIPGSELEPLPEGSFYHFDIVGATVEDFIHGEIGVVERVISTGGTDVLVVRSVEGHEHLLPFCREICRSIDLGNRRIEIEAPEGLFELNAH